MGIRLEGTEFASFVKLFQQRLSANSVYTKQSIAITKKEKEKKTEREQGKIREKDESAEQFHEEFPFH